MEVVHEIVAFVEEKKMRDESEEKYNEEQPTKYNEMVAEERERSK